MKQVLGIYSAPHPHWVGDGFPVRTLFSYHAFGKHISPFLLLDYAGPANFAPTSQQRGVGQHPHRGMETVTIVYQGELQHRDSTGAGGVIGPGDVQWMTAASGIMHEEFHSVPFSQSGGNLEMVQLWVNLPAKHKMDRPGYQNLLNADIPNISLPHGAGQLRVIAGQYGTARGPAHTFTEMDVWDVRVKAGNTVTFPVPSGRNTSLVLLHGSVLINATSVVNEGQFAMLSQTGEEFTLQANTDAVFLILSGAPIDEPIVGQGPFVMNTEAEIRQAMYDLRQGAFGRLAEPA
ncbi:pirin family protein [Chitinivorax sp. B]|uniref:pirin family protein n=1 Tax=Chitinivorax sp. B TaxID=2502235 RepID=UPI0010FA1468|nr:pirin family protein [Chitinivorax sp. B]